MVQMMLCVFASFLDRLSSCLVFLVSVSAFSICCLFPLQSTAVHSHTGPWAIDDD